MWAYLNPMIGCMSEVQKKKKKERKKKISEREKKGKGDSYSLFASRGSLVLLQK